MMESDTVYCIFLLDLFNVYYFWKLEEFVSQDKSPLFWQKNPTIVLDFMACFVLWNSELPLYGLIICSALCGFNCCSDTLEIYSWTLDGLLLYYNPLYTF